MGSAFKPGSGAHHSCRFTGGPGGCDSMAIDVEEHLSVHDLPGEGVVLNIEGYRWPTW